MALLTFPMLVIRRTVLLTTLQSMPNSGSRHSISINNNICMYNVYLFVSVTAGSRAGEIGFATNMMAGVGPAHAENVVME